MYKLLMLVALIGCGDDNKDDPKTIDGVFHDPTAGTKASEKLPSEPITEVSEPELYKDGTYTITFAENIIRCTNGSYFTTEAEELKGTTSLVGDVITIKIGEAEYVGDYDPNNNSFTASNEQHYYDSDGDYTIFTRSLQGAFTVVGLIGVAEIKYTWLMYTDVCSGTAGYSAKEKK